MIDKFGDVQKNFTDLGVFLSALDLQKDLGDRTVLANLHKELNHSYSMFEEGLCAMVPICQKCEKNGQQLESLVRTIDNCVQNEGMTEEAYSELNDFIEVIPQVQLEMRRIYLESLSKPS